MQLPIYIVLLITTMTENQISKIIIGEAIKVHSALGPGLLESVYKECLYYLLQKEGINVEKEKKVPVVFENVSLDCGYRIDLLVENKVVVELKCADFFTDLHLAQVITYLRLGNYKLGLFINFNVPLLKQGIRRVVNNI